VILRVWRGWTDPADAEAYEQFLVGDGEDSALSEMTGEGYLGFDLGRRDHGDEVEFVTILRFTDYDAVEAFAGEEYEHAHVTKEARELLTRWDDEVTHYERRVGERLI
jgi:antibiotic biosynthesis monooxygenase (ABM) superfamily enzyme